MWNNSLADAEVLYNNNNPIVMTKKHELISQQRKYTECLTLEMFLLGKFLYMERKNSEKSQL